MDTSFDIRSPLHGEAFGARVALRGGGDADAFVAASFTKLHMSAKLAFLVLGPMLDIKLLLMFTRVFRLRLILTIATCVVLLTLALCMAMHLVYQTNGWPGMPPT